MLPYYILPMYALYTKVLVFISTVYNLVLYFLKGSYNTIAISSQIYNTTVCGDMLVQPHFDKLY